MRATVQIRDIKTRCISLDLFGSSSAHSTKQHGAIRSTTLCIGIALFLFASDFFSFFMANSEKHFFTNEIYANEEFLFFLNIYILIYILKNVPLSTDDVNIEKDIRRTYNNIPAKRLCKNRMQLHTIAVFFDGIHNYSSGMFSIITQKTIYFGEGAIRSPQRGNTSYFLFCFTNTCLISCNHSILQVKGGHSRTPSCTLEKCL